MPHSDWNESYVTGDAPWDTGEPNGHLVEFVQAIAPDRALEIGCGTGTNSRWLAKQGWEVLGIDVASLAIEKARQKAVDSESGCRFERVDFLNDVVPGGPFNLVFDVGCFHVFDDAEDRQRFAQRVALVLAPGGRWLSIIGSTEGPERDWGPPRRSVRDVAEAIEPAFEILELRSVDIGITLPVPVTAWFCLSRIRAVPAQPSTQSD